jgi:TetR/AcrR family transcriptional repressor of nem operon
MLVSVRYSREQQEETHRRILRSVGRGFRSSGFGGVGVDALAKGAAVTSGAFYGHFRSKADAFRSALTTGLEDLRQAVLGLRAQQGPGWIEALADFYFSERVTCDVADGCALPSLAGEVARSDAKTKTTFEKAYMQLVEALAGGLPGGHAEAEARAIVMTALFAGGVTLARAVRQSERRDHISRILRDAVVACARGAPR